MDLNQQKLTKIEWDTTEIPVSKEEKEILDLIVKGYHDVNIIYNKNDSIINYLRLESNENIMFQLYKDHFEKTIKKLIAKYEFEYSLSNTNKLQKLNSVEKLKLENLNKNIDECKSKIFEFYLLYIVEKVMNYFYKDNTVKFHYYYTLQFNETKNYKFE